MISCRSKESIKDRLDTKSDVKFLRTVKLYLQLIKTNYTRLRINNILALFETRFALANGVLSNYRYISNNCADILNTTLVKQLLLPPPKHGTQNVDWNTVIITTIPSYYKQVPVFCMPVRLPSLVWYNWCIW
jgi:hypothetical protein